MEKWDLYTKYREKTGKEHIRGEKIPEGFYHLVVHVWIRNPKGELQLEAATTDEVAACKWMTVSEIRKLYEEKKLVQTLDYFFCAMEADEPLKKF